MISAILTIIFTMISPNVTNLADERYRYSNKLCWFGTKFAIVEY